MRTCHACKKELDLSRGIARRDACPHCRADLHVCLNCRFYDPGVSKQCREPAAELIRDKDKANFCDYFQFAERAGRMETAFSADQARKALDDLFKK